MNYSLESFIDYCDNMMIAEEGFIDKIKEKVIWLVKKVQQIIFEIGAIISHLFNKVRGTFYIRKSDYEILYNYTGVDAKKIRTFKNEIKEVIAKSRHEVSTQVYSVRSSNKSLMDTFNDITIDAMTESDIEILKNNAIKYKHLKAKIVNKLASAEELMVILKSEYTSVSKGDFHYIENNIKIIDNESKEILKVVTSAKDQLPNDAYTLINKTYKNLLNNLAQYKSAIRRCISARTLEMVKNRKENNYSE